MSGRRMGEFEFAAAQEHAEDEELRWEETNVSSAGVMRCCLESVGNYFESLEEGSTVPVGTRVPCKFAEEDKNHGMTLIKRESSETDGVWLASWIAEKDG